MLEEDVQASGEHTVRRPYLLETLGLCIML